MLLPIKLENKDVYLFDFRDMFQTNYNYSQVISLDYFVNKIIPYAGGAQKLIFLTALKQLQDKKQVPIHFGKFDPAKRKFILVQRNIGIEVISLFREESSEPIVGTKKIQSYGAPLTYAQRAFDGVVDLYAYNRVSLDSNSSYSTKSTGDLADDILERKEHIERNGSYNVVVDVDTMFPMLTLSYNGKVYLVPFIKELTATRGLLGTTTAELESYINYHKTKETKTTYLNATTDCIYPPRDARSVSALAAFMSQNPKLGLPVELLPLCDYWLNQQIMTPQNIKTLTGKICLPVELQSLQQTSQQHTQSKPQTHVQQPLSEQYQVKSNSKESLTQSDFDWLTKNVIQIHKFENTELQTNSLFETKGILYFDKYTSTLTYNSVADTNAHLRILVLPEQIDLIRNISYPNKNCKNIRTTFVIPVKLWQGTSAFYKLCREIAYNLLNSANRRHTPPSFVLDFDMDKRSLTAHLYKTQDKDLVLIVPEQADQPLYIKSITGNTGLEQKVISTLAAFALYFNLIEPYVGGTNIFNISVFESSEFRALWYNKKHPSDYLDGDRRYIMDGDVGGTRRPIAVSMKAIPDTISELAYLSQFKQSFSHIENISPQLRLLIVETVNKLDDILSTQLRKKQAVNFRSLFNTYEKEYSLKNPSKRPKGSIKVALQVPSVSQQEKQQYTEFISQLLNSTGIYLEWLKKGDIK